MSLAIETKNLSKSFGEVHAVRKINLKVREGEIYGFLGLNGAGKTTTIRALLGMIRPSAGSVRVLGKSISSDKRGPWKDIGHSVEKPAAYPELTVKENLEVARRLQGIGDKNAVNRVIAQLQILPYENRKAGHLSTGNFQRLALARALLHNPKLLILDEPASGLDPAGVVEIRELLKRLVKENGLTVFMSSHILTEVSRLATRIGIIHEGRLIEELDAKKLEEMRSQRLEVKTKKSILAKKTLLKAGYSVSRDNEILILKDKRAIQHSENIATILVNAEAPPSQLSIKQENLEDYFLRLTGAKP
ncbi:MAG: ABC transporter ATP-binding protein [Anaerolineae bacterium]|jgi:ABC-2 type transport system ATP-binding protein|nr:ABC transporter ATP-binding protein [Anaerolineae bacterium]MBT7190886.1 ABC transporter ATP-binding protein [Anaerolineae bacterium]MBT7991866.1 ABC transporter ATP-binding protein [Anaerolineae bacterium]